MAIQILTFELPEGVINQPYSAQITTNAGIGGNVGTYEWFILSGDLPNGLELMGGNTESPIISGIPTTPAIFEFVLSVTEDLDGVLSTDTKSFYIMITGSSNPNPPPNLPTDEPPIIDPPSGEILATPNPLLLATGVEGCLEIGGTITREAVPHGFPLAEFSLSTNISYNSQGSVLTKTSGAAITDSFITGLKWYSIKQPFVVVGGLPALATGRQGIIIGIQGDNDLFTFIYAYTTGGEDDWNFDFNLNGGLVVQNRVTGKFQNLQLVSDGTNLIVQREHNYIWRNEVVVPIPSDIKNFRFHFNIENTGNQINWAARRLDKAITPINASELIYTITPNTDQTNRIKDSTHFCITSTVVGDRQIVLSHPDLERTTTINVEVEALFIKPRRIVGEKRRDLDCDDSVIQGALVEFYSNGGLGGILTASGGMVHPNLFWSAPFTEGEIEFEYEVGAVTATCNLIVVPKLEVEGVEDDRYPDIMQGEERTFVSTCFDAVFSSPNYPTIISPNGHLIAPNSAEDEFFGAKDVVIQVNGCGQAIQFSLHIQAMYPTPSFCGATPQKWLSSYFDDYKPIKLELDGGTTQVKNKRKVGIKTWNIDYEALDMNISTLCEEPECDEDLLLAKRIDAFYKQVTEAKRFALIDYHTGLWYKGVRVTDAIGNHTLYETEQVRNLKLRWEGSEVIIPATVPPDESPLAAPVLSGVVPAAPLGFTQINYSWTQPELVLNYRLQISKDSDFIGGITTFVFDASKPPSHSELNLAIGTSYSARVQAFKGLRISAWSNVVTRTTLDDTQAPVVTLQAIPAGYPNVTITAQATDNHLIDYVDFWIRKTGNPDVYLGRDYTGQNDLYSVNWDKSTFANGTYKVVAKGFDKKGNPSAESISSDIIINIDNIPPVFNTFTAEGISTTQISLEYAGTDDSGVVDKISIWMRNLPTDAWALIADRIAYAGNSPYGITVPASENGTRRYFRGQIYDTQGNPSNFLETTGISIPADPPASIGIMREGKGLMRDSKGIMRKS